MKTLEEILGNCRIDEETGCMVWAGGTPSLYAPDRDCTKEYTPKKRDPVWDKFEKWHEKYQASREQA